MVPRTIFANRCFACCRGARCFALDFVLLDALFERRNCDSVCRDWDQEKSVD